MNEHHDEETEHSIQDHQQKLDAKRLLEARIAHVLQTQAARIQFTAGLRNHILQNLPARHTATRRRFLAPALAVVAILLIVFSFSTYLLLNQQPSVQYALKQLLPVPAELAHGGQLLSLDPTGQHIVYQPAQQPGVMYTADLRDLVASNVLAMRYAHDVGWSPDGTELVTTVTPEGATTPLLALVRVGQYMKPLGPDAEAASWSPTSGQQILYITQAQGHTQLWATTPFGRASQRVATMNVAFPVQYIAWSYDGQKLALLTHGLSPQTGSALYVMDTHTHALSTIIKAGGMTIENIGWSPDKQYLAYEQIDRQGHSTLHAVDVAQQKELFKLPVQKNLAGYSWSRDSGAIVYSDGGLLHMYTLHGTKVQLPTIAATQYDPFWLKDGRILYLNITNGEGRLAILAA